MRYRVYRNLDRPFTFFGVQGRYIPVALCALGAVLVFSLILGSAIGSFVGFATALLLGAGAYLGLLEVQGR